MSALMFFLCFLSICAVAAAGNACAATPSRKAAAGAPNIVLFLTDDMDKQLGGWDPMVKATRRLSEKGATASNWMIHTPVCCPSRAELLTGRYFHNIKTTKASDQGCMHVNVTELVNHSFYSEWYFAPYLQQAGYTVGMFGKQLNNYNPRCPPPGVDRWFANGGGNYFSPSFFWASAGTHSTTVNFNNCTYNDGRCYSTSVIGNVSLAWMRDVISQPEERRKPFFAYIAVKAPHIQDGPGWPVALPAPWYNDTAIFTNLRAPRTPSWNASCPDHHWLIRQQSPLTAEEAQKSDALYRDRHLALLSVDDLVEEVIAELEAFGAANNTYFLFTSDHGYQLGQFRMPQGKWNVYDNNLRIPMVIRGPGIAANSTFDYIATNVDTMPTILGFAGVETPSTMDGQNLAPFLVTNLEAAPEPTRKLLVRQAGQEWRTMQLIEYNGLGNVVRYQHLEDTSNNTFRALRAVGKNRNFKLVEFTNWDNWDFKKPADEYEFFNLDTDPWEMRNLWKSIDPTLKQDLQLELERLFRCQGKSCRPRSGSPVPTLVI